MSEENSKNILEKIIYVWNNKKLFHRALETIIIIVLLIWLTLGNHTLKFNPFEYIYKSPIEIWKATPCK